MVAIHRACAWSQPPKRLGDHHGPKDVEVELVFLD